jgi:prepilin-type N-terminal cleavage/methylation domain-containing protein
VTRIRAHFNGPRLRPGDGRRRCARPANARRGFTLVELLVVVSIVVLILAMAVPGLSAMNAQMRMTSAERQIQSMLKRAYYQALADKTMTAVRFVPGNWIQNEEGDTGASRRQQMVLYRYVGSTERYDGSTFVTEFNEYFERVPGVDSLELPEGVWVAPYEALDEDGFVRLNFNNERTFDDPKTFNQNFGRAFVLSGVIGEFAYDANIANGNDDQQRDGLDLLDADDFFIVFDPQTGVVSNNPTPFRIKAYSPSAEYEIDRDHTNDSVFYQRFGFTGIVLYEREGFVGVGNDPTARQDYLKNNGKPFVVHRSGGGLIGGGPEEN